ncbi:MAG: hypothetical protein K2M48_02710, partial [Clostridiales bacterium]|nr:hypothetical protein [Clostridiales bacterium]
DHTHCWATTCAPDATHHWQGCSGCEELNDKAAHVDEDEDGKCDVCEHDVDGGEEGGGEEEEEPDTALIEDSFYLVGDIASVGSAMWAATVGYRVDKGLKIHLTPNDTLKVVQYKGVGEEGQNLKWLNDSTAPDGVLSQYASAANNVKVAEEGDYIVKGYADHFLIYKDGAEPKATCDIKGSWTNDSWDNTYGMKSVTPAEGALYQFEYTMKIQNPAGANFGVQFYTTDASEGLKTGWCDAIAEDSAVKTITSAGVYKFTVSVTADGGSITIENATDGDEDVTAPWVNPNATTTTVLTVNLSNSESVTLKINHPLALELTSIHAWGTGTGTSWPGATISNGVVDLTGLSGSGISLIIVADSKQTDDITNQTFENGATYILTLTAQDGSAKYACTVEKE